MTIQTSPASNLFAGFNDDEKQEIAIAIRRVEEIEETRRITAGLAGEARGIETDLKARGVNDNDVLREAAEAVAATRDTEGKLAHESRDYLKLFGPDGRASAAVGQYVQLLRNAHAGDVNALNMVQAARRELYEARNASAQHHQGNGLAGDLAPDADMTEQRRRSGIGAEQNEVILDAERQRDGRGRPVQIGRTLVEENNVQPRHSAGVAQDLTTALPAVFADRYLRVGNKIVDPRDQEHVILVDKGAKLQVPREFDSESVQAAVDVAEARNWSSMHVKGDERFRQAVWLEAASRGIAVKGYTPTQAEQAWASREAERQGKTSQVNENATVKAFQDARTPAERRAAAATHPALKKAFALEANYSHLANHIKGESGRDAFMNRMREHITEHLAKGIPLPNIQVRQPVMDTKEYTRHQDREHDRGRGR